MVEPKKASMTVLGGPLSGQRFLLPESGPATIGSADEASFSLALGSVAPYHLRMEIEGGRVTVFSQGGPVAVNDDAVRAEGTVLRNGDIVWLGNPGADEAVMLQCVLPRQAPATAVEAPAADAGLTQPPAAPVRPSPAEVLEITHLDVAEEAAEEAEAVMAEPVEAEVAEAEAVEAEPVVVEEAEAETVVLAPAKATTEQYPVFIDETEPESFVVEEPPATLPATPPPAPAPTVVLPPVRVVARPAAPTATPPAPSAPTPVVVPRVAAPPAAAPPAAAPPVHSTAPAQASGAHPPARPAVHPPLAHGPSARRVAKGGTAGKTIVWTAAGLVGLAAVAGLGYVGWRTLASSSARPQVRPPALAQATPAPPVPAAATPGPIVTASPEASVAPSASPTTPAATALPAAAPTPRPTPTPPGKPTPTPTPQGRPTPTPAAAPRSTTPAAPATTTPQTAAPDTGAQVQALVGQSEAALAARQYDAAIGDADAILRLDPSNTRASALKADAARRRDLARRHFVTGATAVQAQKAGGGGLAGFESGDADVRRAPDFQGRIEFEMTPPSGLEAGTAWSLRAFVVNEGKKPIRVQGVTIVTSTNGAAGGGPVPPKTRDIAPQQRALVGETAGTWADGTSAWSAEVTVTANKGDSLRTTLGWR